MSPKDLCIESLVYDAVMVRGGVLQEVWAHAGSDLIDGLINLSIGS